MNDDNDTAAPQLNEGADNMDNTTDFFDWEKIVHEAENADDDSSSVYMEEDEELPTDDDLECVSDNDSALIEISDFKVIEMLPRGYAPDIPASIELSEDSKALLFWRDEKDGMSSFSDWKIKVEAERTEDDDCSEGSMVTVYNVHRLVLAMGPKKSGYFEALLQSDCYSENSDCVSTVKLPEKVAKQFPDFLDYLYAQPLESAVVINFENWESMKYLANYFLVPRLTEAVAEFIENDMEFLNLDHMEKYISEFHRDISDDMSRRILPKAVCICAKMFQLIEVDSPLLMSIPPAMLRSIMRRLRVDDKQETLHTLSLLAAYAERNFEDSSIFVVCFCGLPIELWLLYNLEEEIDDGVIELAFTWFRLLTKRGWHIENEDSWFWYHIPVIISALEGIISKYLRSKTPSLEMMERIVRDVPNDVVARVFRASVDEARTLRDEHD